MLVVLVDLVVQRGEALQQEVVEWFHGVLALVALERDVQLAGSKKRSGRNITDQGISTPMGYVYKKRIVGK